MIYTQLTHEQRYQIKALLSEILTRENRTQSEGDRPNHQGPPIDDQP